MFVLEIEYKKKLNMIDDACLGYTRCIPGTQGNIFFFSFTSPSLGTTFQFNSWELYI